MVAAEQGGAAAPAAAAGHDAGGVLDHVIGAVGDELAVQAHDLTRSDDLRLAEKGGKKLVDGPFSLLDGTWAFLALGRSGSETKACKIEFDLRYAFASKALETVLSPVFDRVANTFVESFVARAEAVYGPR